MSAFAHQTFLRPHIIQPLLLLLAVTSLIGIFDLDRALADFLYHLEGGHWAWRNTWLAEVFFHRGGRTLSQLLGIGVIGAFAWSLIAVDWRPHRRALGYLALALLGGTVVVSALKASLAVSCPWDFQRYGGKLVYAGVMEQLLQRSGKGCFPAGHASAGYVWVAIYFFGLHYQARWRRLALGAALLAGLTFGLAQQFRGAHFLSHDVWTLAVCWFVSAGLYQLMLNRAPATEVIRHEFA